MISTTSSSRRAVVSVCGLVLLLSGALSACSSGSSKAGAGATATPAATPATSGAARQGGRAGLFSDPKVTQCLSAAGISIPSRAPGARPSFSGPFPSGSARPTFGGTRPSGAPGGFLGGAEGTKIEQALKACGITLPARGAAGAATPPA